MRSTNIFFVVRSDRIRWCELGEGDETHDQQVECADVYLDRKQLEHHLLTYFHVRARDLARVATAVYQADRLARRHPKGSRDVERQLQWQRQIHLDIEVEQPEVWSGAQALLVDTLGFMTDDHWSFKFSKGHEVFSQLPLLQDCLPVSTEVGLFSGGLDSAAGLQARIRSSDDLSCFIAISIGSAGRQHQQKGRAFNQIVLPPGKKTILKWVNIRHGLRGIDWTDHDPTQRTRGFLYFSLAASVASCCKLTSVASYENGYGCLNPAMSAGQVGSMSTRSMHPGTLIRLEKLIHEVLGEEIRIDLPFFWHTKGDICQLVQHDLRGLAEWTMSCDEGERNKSDLTHCGMCTSCLLRRVAIHYVLGNGDPTQYRFEATKHAGLYDTDVYKAQALRLRTASKDWLNLCLLEPTLRHAEPYFIQRGMSRENFRKRVCDLLMRHATQSLQFLSSESVRCSLGLTKEN